MGFASPWWLIGLAPWAALVMWLLIGRRERTEVPFLEMWRGSSPPPGRPKAAMQRPPLEVALTLVAILLGIIGSAGPQVRPSRPNDPLTSATPSTQSLPTTRPQNLAIVAAAVGLSPHLQVMIRVRNDSDLRTAELKVGDATRPIDLPPRSEQRNYFVDLASAAPTIDISLSPPDDQPADNAVKLSQHRSWPAIEPRGQLAPEILRVIAAYTKFRPTGPSATRVAVTDQSVNPNQLAIIIPRADSRSVSGTPQVTDHPINAHVDLPAIVKEGVRVANAPGDGWRTIASFDNMPLVAVREAPARQVWIGFTSDAWPRSSNFVVFWTNVFDSFADGPPMYAVVAATAVSAAAVSAPLSNPSPTSDAPQSDRAKIDLSPAMLLGSLFLLFVAALARSI